MTRTALHRPVSPGRRVAVASVAVLALTGLSACGGNSGSADKATDQPSQSTAASASSNAGSSGASAPSSGSSISADQMAGLVQTALSKATSAHITMASSGSTGLQAQGDADFGPPVAMQMTMTLPQMGDAEVRLVDNTIYLKLPQLSGDKFLKVPLDDPNSPLGSMGDLLDPSKLLSQLGDSITSATYVGKEDVDGDQADHYTMTVDGSKLLGGLSSALPSGAASAASSAAAQPETLDVWFDDQGRVRQVKTDSATTGNLQMDYTKWGEPVHVEAPPASQVTDMPGMPSSSS